MSMRLSKSQGLFAPRSFLTALVGAAALMLVGCGGSSATNPGTGSGGSKVTGSGGNGSGSGGMTTGSGGSGSGGTDGSGGAVGSGGGSVDAPVEMAPMEVAPETAPDVPMGPFALKSSAFMNGTAVPLMHKCAQAGNPPMGMNISPPLNWTAGPAGTMSYAITLNHQASGSKHWAIWDIPGDVYSLPMNLDHVAMPPPPAPVGSKQTRQAGLDGFTGYGYLGPCPQNAGLQMYVFTLYAIKASTIPGITTMSTVDAVFAAIQSNMVAGGRVTLIGTQQRQ